MAHEVAETLARRVRLSILTHPVLIAVTILTIPGASRRLAFNLPWGVLILMITEIRYRTTAAFDQLYPADPRRWYRMFRAGALASVIAWDAFAIHEMNAGGDGWPTWMMLLMTAGIGAGATTSLRPGPPLLRWFLVSLLTPQIVWGLHRGGADGVAIVLVSSAFLTLIQIQGNHNASVFWRSTRDKEALRAARQRLESLVNSIDGVVWESDLQRSRSTSSAGRPRRFLGTRWIPGIRNRSSGGTIYTRRTGTRRFGSPTPNAPRAETIRWSFANDSFLRLHGYSREEVLSKPISLVFAPVVTPELAATIRDCTSRGGWRGCSGTATRQAANFRSRYRRRWSKTNRTEP